MYRIPRYTISLIKEKSLTTEYPNIHNSQNIFNMFKDSMNTLDRENFWILTMDAKNKIIGMNIVSTGSLSTSVVHPREVLKLAILQNAGAIVCMHNHPSGVPVPSREDNECTNRLAEACKIMGIKMLDHIIFGESDYYSYADLGRIPQ